MAIPQAHNNSKTKMNERDEWQTPLELFQWLDDRHRFDFDMAASAKNTLCAAWFDSDDDALRYSWGDHFLNGFCNPPFSMKDEFINKAIAECNRHNLLTVTMLLPYSPDMGSPFVFTKSGGIYTVDDYTSSLLWGEDTCNHVEQGGFSRAIAAN